MPEAASRRRRLQAMPTPSGRPAHQVELPHPPVLAGVQVRLTVPFAALAMLNATGFVDTEDVWTSNAELVADFTTRFGAFWSEG